MEFMRNTTLIGEMRIFGRKGPSGFSWSSTAEEVTRGIDASALTAIVTGASSGIGAETSRVLASRGVRVIMAVRNVDSGKRVERTIIQEIPDGKIDVMELDLASFASVRKFASEYNNFLALPLNILINNAGVFAPPFTLSQDKVEMQFAVNHLGHFLLTNLLLDNMKKTARESRIEGRIVNISSLCNQHPYPEGIRFEQINDSSSYNGIYAYGQSKLANVLHANELARRFKEQGVEITANSLHPGTIGTDILRHHDVFKWMCRSLYKSIPQGAATTCYVALHPQVRGVSGKYFVDCNISTPSSLAADAELAKKLWDFSLDLTQESS